MLNSIFAAILIFSGFVAPVRADVRSFLENIRSDQIDRVYSLTLQVQNRPQPMAREFVARLKQLGHFGWQLHFEDELKTLNLMAYLHDLEKAQFYASAGRWTVPPHPQQYSHFEFYKRRLNPDHAPYSTGVLSEAFREFSNTFLEMLMLEPTPATRELVRMLMQTQRDFWASHVIETVFLSPTASTEFVADLILNLDVKDGYFQSDFTPVARAILGRLERGHSDADRTSLLNTLFTVIAIRRPDTTSYVLVSTNRGFDCSDVLRVHQQLAGLPLPKIVTN